MRWMPARKHRDNNEALLTQYFGCCCYVNTKRIAAFANSLYGQQSLKLHYLHNPTGIGIMSFKMCFKFFLLESNYRITYTFWKRDRLIMSLPLRIEPFLDMPCDQAWHGNTVSALCSSLQKNMCIIYQK